VTAVAASSTRVDLAWGASTDNVGVTGYSITRNGSPLTTVGGTVTSFADTTASPSTAYTYVVRASDAAGNTSGPSNSAQVTTPAGGGGGATFTFAPSDDSYVDQAAASSNFGTATRVVADNSPVQDGLFKFAVATGACSVSTATLSLTVGSGSSDGSAKGGDLRAAANNNWSEGAVTWANAPAASGAILGTLGAVNANATYTFNVKPVVAGDGTFSFRLSTTSSDGVRYFSKEGSTTLRPKLTVVCS
jgi:chitodextrinase